MFIAIGYGKFILKVYRENTPSKIVFVITSWNFHQLS